jgi:hypothetical protein
MALSDASATNGLPPRTKAASFLVSNICRAGKLDASCNWAKVFSDPVDQTEPSQKAFKLTLHSGSLLILQKMQPFSEAPIGLEALVSEIG